jgi:hypothetical protein
MSKNHVLVLVPLTMSSLQVGIIGQITFSTLQFHRHTFRRLIL